MYSVHVFKYWRLGERIKNTEYFFSVHTVRCFISKRSYYWFAIAPLITAASVVGTSERKNDAYSNVFLQPVVAECIPEMNIL